MRININPKIIIAIKVLVLLVIAVLLQQKVDQQKDIFAKIYLTISNSIKINWATYLFVFLLMFINWFIEALKWKLLIAKVSIISIMESFKGVLSGLTLGFATPHGLGDYFGRILSVQSKNRTSLVGALFVSRAMQMSATAAFGLIGLYYLFGSFWLLSGMAICVLAVLLVLAVLKGLYSIDSISNYIQIIRTYSWQELFKVQTLAVVRYLVFTSQFVLLLKFFIDTIGIELAFAGSTYIFLTKSVLPTFNFLSDLGIREYSAIYFFEKFGVDVIPVISASLTLWLINILIPTIVGIPMMLNLKWQKEPTV